MAKYGNNMAMLQIIRRSMVLLALFTGLSLSADPGQEKSLTEKLHEAVDARSLDVGLFQRALTSSDLSLQKTAIIGLGRIGGPASVKTLAPFLYSPQPDIRKNTAYALAISEHESSYKPLIQRLKIEKEPHVLAELLPAVGFVGKTSDEPDRISLILPFLDHPHTQVKAATCDALQYAWTVHRETISVPNSTQVFKLLSLSQESEELADHCLYALTRLRTEVALFDNDQLLKTIQTLTTDNHHKLMLLILSAHNNPNVMEYVKSQLTAKTDHSVQAEAAKVLGTYPYNEELEPLYQSILTSDHSQVKSGFIDGFSRAKPEGQALVWLEQLSNDKNDWIRYRAQVLLYAADPEKHHQALSAMFQSNKSVQAVWQLLALQVINATESGHKEKLLALAANSEHQMVKELVASLSESESDETEEPDPVADTPAYAKIKSLISQRLTITTSRGDIVIQLLPSAAYSSYRFQKLALEGFYDGTVFHRVIPNFVAQGGDPTGTGMGGPGYRIREELYPDSHLRGTVGMATTGKDTAGSQFFINLKDNLHLDRRYTIFGRVVAGMDIADQLAQGDYVKGIKLTK